MASAKTDKKYYTYILQCGDGSFYTGYTTDLAHRVAVHQAGRGGRYTRSRLPVKLVYHETYDTRHEAMRREALIKKRLNHAEKKTLIATGHHPKLDDSLEE